MITGMATVKSYDSSSDVNVGECSILPVVMGQ